jgi:probable addiction module antidote protein
MRTIKRGRYSPSVPYRDWLLDRIQRSPDRGLGYLQAAWEDGYDTFLVALKDVVDARGGISRLAKRTGLHRVSLHGALSKSGNPRLANLNNILDALGIRLTVVPKSVPKRRAKAG